MIAGPAKGDRVDRNIRTVDDVLRLLDGLFAPEADRSKPVPFFVGTGSELPTPTSTASPVTSTAASPTRRNPCAGSSPT
jgi:hypothetical protein